MLPSWQCRHHVADIMLVTDLRSWRPIFYIEKVTNIKILPPMHLYLKTITDKKSPTSLFQMSYLRKIWILLLWIMILSSSKEFTVKNNRMFKCILDNRCFKNMTMSQMKHQPSNRTSSFRVVQYVSRWIHTSYSSLNPWWILKRTSSLIDLFKILGPHRTRTKN